MEIEQIDKNFQLKPIQETDVEWFNASKAPFSLHGVYYSEEHARYERMPLEIAETVNVGVKGMSAHTAGGRIRFMTNSPYVAVKCVVGHSECMRNMAFMAHKGVSVFAGDEFIGAYAPDNTAGRGAVDGKIAFEGIAYLPTLCLEEITVHLPPYSGTFEVYIGVKQGSVIQEPKAYKYAKPAVFYGSSITQGGCCTHAGNDYIAMLSRWLDFDYINLGFSGSGKAEETMTDYLASLDCSVMVLDYDHNAPNVEYLEQTHFPAYEKIRKAHPKMPIVFISRPDFKNKDDVNRREVIKNTYKAAKKRGDKRVWFIDGEKLFQKHERSACTVDGCHPNDLGFYRMAQTIQPILKKALKKS